jgi:hypothetical protein
VEAKTLLRGIEKATVIGKTLSAAARQRALAGLALVMTDQMTGPQRPTQPAFG